MIDFEAVKKQSTEEYFKGNQFSIDAFNKKYTLFEGETYVQAVKRVCDYIASAENSLEKQAYWSARWFDEIYNDWWHPAGSIMQGAASGKNYRRKGEAGKGVFRISQVRGIPRSGTGEGRSRQDAGAELLFQGHSRARCG
jgi:hypothetical protein